MTVVNDYSGSIDVQMNDTFVRAPAQARTGPVAVTPGWEGSGNDVFNLARTDDASCGTGSANGAFQDRQPRYELHIESTGIVGCGDGHEGFRAYVEPGHQGI